MPQSKAVVDAVVHVQFYANLGYGQIGHKGQHAPQRPALISNDKKRGWEIAAIIVVIVRESGGIYRYESVEPGALPVGLVGCYRRGDRQ